MTFHPALRWQTARFELLLDEPKVMGIVNVTPDSFSDGGQHASARDAIALCERLVAEGAHLLDIGGESTRPGAAAPDPNEESRRVLPVLRVAVTLGVPVSVDTSNPWLMRQALEAGADIVNDVRALARPGAVEAVAAHPRAGVCLMHMRGEPATMMQMTHYTDVVAEVGAWLAARACELRNAGIATERMALDPGYGFAKLPADNLQLLRGQGALAGLGHPLLVGLSRKSALGVITGRPVGERLGASIAAALAAVQRGAHIVRVHDVAATVDALKVWRAVGLMPPALHVG